MGTHTRKASERPSFFKILIDYTRRFRLPPVFVQKYGQFLPESAKLRTSCGKTWGVKLEEEITDDDEKYMCFIGGGWSRFVKDLELKFGEFLVFWFNVGDSTFDVSVYGTHCCERQISVKDVFDVDSDADHQDFELKSNCYDVPEGCKKRLRSNCIPESEGCAVNLGRDAHPRFEAVLTENRLSRWSIPKKFVEAAKLREKRAVVLEYPPRNRYWAVILQSGTRTYSKLNMTVGWTDFRKENGLVMGKTYSFEFDPLRNVIQVKDCKDETS